MFYWASSPTDLIIDVLARARGPVYGTVLADRVGYSPSGMYKRLAQLVAAGVVEKAGRPGERRGYQLVRQRAA